MNLTQIRQTLGDLSGRNDLAEENTDLADFFINEGVKFLDRNSETQKSWAVNYSYLAIGGWNVQVNNCRAIKEVWVGSTTARWRLEKKDIKDLMNEYMYGTLVNLDSGSPTYYSPAVTRTVPEGTALPVGISSYVDVISSSGPSYNAIIIAPASDELLIVEITGLFYSKALTNPTDSNYWSVNHPSLLIQAALREIEVFNRNSTGVKDWEMAIHSTLDSINKDFIEEVIADVDQMEKYGY